MLVTKEITTRTLLRNFKEIKEKLLRGDVNRLIINTPEGNLVIQNEKSLSKTTDLLNYLNESNNKRKINKRINLWEDMDNIIKVATHED